MAASVPQYDVLEKTTAQLTAQLLDETGVPVPAASLATLTLTLYDRATGTILNSRSAQNVLNTNNVTVDGSGNIVWDMQPADNAIIGTGYSERHIALFQWTWPPGSGNKSGKAEVAFQVRNLSQVT